MISITSITNSDYSETKILKLRTLISVTLVVNHFDEELELLPEIEKKSF